jgi:glycosyltransferase involved in cell wall biosynthesis
MILFSIKGGGERLILMIANALEADIASGFFSPGSYDLRAQGFKWAMIPLMPWFFLHEFTWMPRKMAFIFKNGLRHFGLKWAFSMNVRKLRDTYDTVILSGDCLSATRHFQGKKVLYYCHTIPRYLFDQREQYEQKVPKAILPLYRVMTAVFRKAYLRDLSRIKELLTNSKNTQKRIKTFTNRDAEILYPPVDTQFFSPSEKNWVQSTESDNKNSESAPLWKVGRGDSIECVESPPLWADKKYYLSFARLSSIKRVDRIVRAFQGMPEEKLVITYGKNDPEKANIQSLIEWYDNISMKESPSDEELRTLIRGAKATIYVPVDEDFGMSPVESMSCGTPVIGVDDGGLRESIIDGKTGILIDVRCHPEDIRDAVKTIQTLGDLSWACIARGSDFSLKTFEQILRTMLAK